MSVRPVEPRSSAGGPLTPYVVLGVAGSLFAGAWLAWPAGRLAALLSGHPAGPAFSGIFVSHLVRGEWSHVWPGVSPALVAVCYGGLLSVVLGLLVGAGMWWQRHRPSPDDPRPAMAGAADTKLMTLRGVAERARRLRPGLAGRPLKSIGAGDCGVALGAHRLGGRGPGPVLYASWEDVLLAVMAPRTNKTTALAVPAVLDAPGPVVATSNKPDLWATTYAAREASGRVWVFDPQAITHTEQSWWWNPLASATNVEDAHRLADHFVQQIRHGKGDDFWSLGALDLLTSLILAAACERGTLHDVQRWLSETTSREPAAILRRHGFVPSSRALAGRQAGAPETREGMYETARTAAACLANPQIMTWVTPRRTPVATFDLDGFVNSTDTLYLLSKDGAGAAAPLVAGLTDQVMRQGVRHAELRGGRLDPPLLTVLDEAANICRVSDLPELFSHLGSRGIVPITILQSYQQGTRVWGDRGMGAMWGASTVKLVGPGMDDARFAEDLSRLVGERDIPVASRTRDGSGHGSWQTSVRRQRILDPADLRAMPKGTALMLATGSRPALLELLPWYAGSRARQLAADLDAAIGLITRNANSSPARPAGGIDTPAGLGG